MEPNPPPLPYASVVALPVSGPAGLTPEQLQQITDARLRMKKIRKAVGYANFDGWTILIFGAFTFLGGFMSWIGFVMGAVMGVIGYVELRGAKRLKELDASAATTLAKNQLALGLLLFTYAVYSLWTVFTGPSAIGTAMKGNPELSGMLGDVEGMEKLIGAAVYGTLIAISIFVQGATALFYLARRKHVDAYLNETPQWLIDAQRAGMMV